MSHPTPLISSRVSSLAGLARIPGDKSMSHRALMFGGLAAGETIIHGLLEGEDVLATGMAMRALGARVHHGEDGLWRVHGVGTACLQTPDKPLDMGNSGTSTRLLMGIVAGHPITTTFTGDASLSKRPMKRVMTPLMEMGAVFSDHQDGRLPMTVTGSDSLKAITYRLPVASAQVKSAVLLAGLRAQGTTTVIEETPTRDHTENMLRGFGVTVGTETLPDGAHAIHIAGGQSLEGCSVDIPADPSSAAFPVVAALLAPAGRVELPRIGMNSRRNGLYITLREMGADIVFRNERLEAGEPVADLLVSGGGALTGVDVPADRVPSMIDEFPALAMAASCAAGTTRMTGLAELRVKESDRLLLVAEGLKACGVDLEMGEDWLTIHGTGKPPRGGATVATALDHRIAMSFLALGTATQEPIRIDDGRPIATSFPPFVALMNELGARIETP
ncbi:MAG: 3-phosphoshikimate 1-carboxyvinyltransferase [Alphaproteobacteria bacterium]|nr:3-phosphoshikimate 1-carboxyvinyltransferase [Alphaproteobacteria bacterium]